LGRPVLLEINLSIDERRKRKCKYASKEQSERELGRPVLFEIEPFNQRGGKLTYKKVSMFPT
jgi:hypothetical protein